MRKKTKKITPPGNNQKKTDPLKITTARIFFCLNAALWLGYGVYIYYDMAVVNHNTSSADVVTLFSFANAGLLLFSGIKFGKPKKWVYYFALAIAVFNTLLTLLNIVDLYFLLSFIIDLLILWAILPFRKKYFLNS
jgi:Na+/melibiose symporter-like transporter